MLTTTLTGPAGVPPSSQANWPAVIVAAASDSEALAAIAGAAEASAVEAASKAAQPVIQRMSMSLAGADPIVASGRW